MNNQFLPISKADMQARGWEEYDFLFITADAYVDHPSFGPAILSRLLELDGFRVAILAQPDWKNPAAFTALGRPRLGVLISGGNIDSMVAHYTVAKKRRHDDAYSPGNEGGKRPDRATIVYANRVRQVFGDIPMVIGGLEASLRRFAHYDYWEDKVRRSLLFDAQADLLIYGMGEIPIRAIAARLASGTPISEITDIRGTCFMARHPGECQFPRVEVPSFEAVVADKTAYAQANKVQYEEHDAVYGKAILQKHGDHLLITNPPSIPPTTQELDLVYSLPYVGEPHSCYDELGGVPAIEEVRFSLAHNRGCFGACNFCSLAFHQGRFISSRSHQSVLEEAKRLVQHKGFKGYIHDVGGPTANFRRPACQKQIKHGLCKNRACLSPEACPNLDADHSDYLQLLREVRGLPGIKKVFIRSGIRFDFLLRDKISGFFSELVKHHVSGQLKVAPEHCAAGALSYMGKPDISVYEQFRKKYEQLNKKMGKEQYLVPYLMSSHPGCTLADAVELACWLNRSGRQPEQVQDFYPTPGTLSTCMYHTGIDPRTMTSVYVPKDPHEKAMQRALMQWKRPEKRRLVLEALRQTGREDLIGYGKECLLRPNRPQGGQGQEGGYQGNRKPYGQKPDSAKGKKPGQSCGKPTGKGMTSDSGQAGKLGKFTKGNKPTGTKSTGTKARKESPSTQGTPNRKSGWAKPKAKPNPRPGGKRS